MLEPHPAFGRFISRQATDSRILFITAASGTGSEWFAHSWLGSDEGEVHDLSDPRLDTLAQTEKLYRRSLVERALKLAIILAPSVSIWDFVARYECLVAEHLDLLLTAPEVARYAKALLKELPHEEISHIYRSTGGWLKAVEALVNDPESVAVAYQVIRNGFSLWIENQQSMEKISEAAFLMQFDKASTCEFFGEIASENYTPEHLEEMGLLYLDENNNWVMPTLVRRVLTERIKFRSPERAALLEHVAVSVLAKTHSVEVAADLVLKKRSWTVLHQLLMDRWVDLFTSNPQHLRVLSGKFPKFITDRTSYIWVGLRILGSVGTDRMILPFPTIEPRYSDDKTSQSLREQSSRLQRNPNMHAVTVGLLETTYLRLAGLYSESAEAARRLNSLIERAYESHKLNPSLAAFALLHVGISLQLMNRTIEARRAFESAMQRAESVSGSFLIADIADKLAFTSILTGDHQQARYWITRNNYVINTVGWGKRMVQRNSVLASALISLSRLDLCELRNGLANMPQTPDSDELWAVHTYLIAMAEILNGTSIRAVSLVYKLQKEREFAMSPLSQDFLNDALILALFFDPEGGNRLDEYVLKSRPLTALYFLREGQPDKALRLLGKAGCAAENDLWPCLTAFLQLAARFSQGPTPAAIQRVKQLYEGAGSPFEIALLSLVPHWGEIPTQIELPSGVVAKIESLKMPVSNVQSPAPQLTPRELDILNFLREGKTRKEIAELTFRSENTIKTQMRSLYRKLQATDLHQALHNARLWNL